MKNPKLLLLNLFFTGFLSAQQLFINREWEISNGNPGNMENVALALDPAGNLVLISNHKTGNNANIFIKSVRSNGEINWQQTNLGLPLTEDYGVDVKIDASGNVYACGAKHNGVNYDYFMAKYDPSGTLIWQQIYNGTSNGNDVPTALEIDGKGNVYVTGSSFDNKSDYDFATLKLSGLNGTIQWVKRYDFSKLYEIPTDIAIDHNGDVLVCGASAQNTLNSDFAVVKYNGVTGNQVQSKRHNSPNNGYDLPSEMVIDVNNNLYVVGTANNNTSNKDIKLIAYSSSLQIQWTKYLDKSGNADEAYGLSLDDVGNILITGYFTKANGGTNQLTGKFDKNNGNQLWLVEQSALNDMASAKGHKIKTDSKGNSYTSGIQENNGKSELITRSFDAQGKLRWEKTFSDGVNGSFHSSQLLVRDGEVFVTGHSKEFDINKSITLKYVEHEKPIRPIPPVGPPTHNANELIVRFNKSVINEQIINRIHTEAGNLVQFVNNDMLAQLQQATGFDWTNLQTFKIHRRMTTADNVSVNRLGETIVMDDFWATLSIFVSADHNLDQVIQSLGGLYPSIVYAEKNVIGQLLSDPNDNFYTLRQAGLFDNQYGINVNAAWDKQVGQFHTKVGVFDTGINWRHEDFGDGTTSGTKVIGGWDFYNNAALFSQTNPDEDGHGTGTSGIIGALRNNGIGVAGIAGGDMQNGNVGCQLFSLKITQSSTEFIDYANIAAAIIEGAAYNPATGYGYGLHIQNHSWGGGSSFTLRDAVRTCNLNNCIFIAASGNDNSNVILYPASYPDNWVLKVGASDTTGSKTSLSVYGNDLDVIAPGTKDIYQTLDFSTNTSYGDIGDGTSIAAPHVSGVAALLYSEHHINNGYPNNLAHEDVEYFLQKFATDILPFSYDEATGHGRINASASLEKVSLPNYFVKHFGGQSNTSQSVTSNVSIQLLEGINDLAVGQYSADRYEITHTYTHVFPLTQTVLDCWPRFGSSIGYSDNPTILNDNAITTSFSINQNVVTVTAKTNAWFIAYDQSPKLVNKWIPVSPDKLITGYSLHIQDNAITGISVNNSIEKLEIYPNPSSNLVYITYNVLSLEHLKLELVDPSGRIIAIPSLKEQQLGENKLTLDISTLAQGIYFLNLSTDNQLIVKPLIKQ